MVKKLKGINEKSSIKNSNNMAHFFRKRIKSIKITRNAFMKYKDLQTQKNINNS